MIEKMWAIVVEYPSGKDGAINCQLFGDPREKGVEVALYPSVKDENRFFCIAGIVATYKEDSVSELLGTAKNWNKNHPNSKYKVVEFSRCKVIEET